MCKIEGQQRITLVQTMQILKYKSIEKNFMEIQVRNYEDCISMKNLSEIKAADSP